MTTDKTVQRRSYAPSFKLTVLEEAAQEGAVAAEVARKHGLTDQLVYGWRHAEKAIRKAAKKELKQEMKQPNGKTNGLANGVSHDAAEPKTTLKIVGITPLIQELVTAELAKQLPALVEAKLAEVVATELQNAFNKR